MYSPMNLSQTSWSNPLLFNQSTTSLTLHSIGGVSLRPCTVVDTGMDAGPADTDMLLDCCCWTWGAFTNMPGADEDEAMLLCFELICPTEAGEGNPFGISRTGVLLLFSSIRCILGRVVVGGEIGLGYMPFSIDGFSSGFSGGGGSAGTGDCEAEKEGLVAVGISVSSFGGTKTSVDNEYRVPSVAAVASPSVPTFSFSSGV